MGPIMAITSEAIRRQCASLGLGATISTKELVRAIVGPAEGPQDYEAVKRLIRSGEVIGFYTVGVPVTRRGRTIRPTIWHAPKPLCPHCGGTGFATLIAEPSDPAAELILNERQRNNEAAGAIWFDEASPAWEVEAETERQRAERIAAQNEATRQRLGPETQEED